MTYLAKKEKSTLLFVFGGMLVLSLTVLFTPFAMSQLGASALVAENLYNVLNIIGYGAAAAAIVSSLGVGSVAVTGIVALARKWTLRKFTTW